MTKSQNNCTWLDKIYQPQSFQTTIFTGFDFRKINPLAIVINDFVNSMDFSFFKQYYHSNNIQGGRPPYNYKTLFKIYIYMLYNNISINKLNEFYSLGSNLHFLSQELKKLPSREVFTNFLKVLDNHIDEIFILHLKYISNFIKLDYKNLYGDGTIFEAHNNRHKIITDTNINRSNTKWNNVLNDCNSTEEMKKLAKKLDDVSLIKKVEHATDDTDDIKIYIGEETEFDSNVTIIRKKYVVNGEEKTIAIIGPKRMDYQRIVALLNYIDEEIDNRKGE